MTFSALQFPSIGHRLGLRQLQIILLLIVGACGFVNFSFVMIRYYCFDVTHAAVAVACRHARKFLLKNVLFC